MFHYRKPSAWMITSKIKDFKLILIRLSISKELKGIPCIRLDGPSDPYNDK